MDKKIKLILFDIDSTLVHGEQASKYYKQYSAVLEKALSIGLNISLEEAKRKADEHRKLFNGRGEKAFETYGVDMSLWHSMICTDLDPSLYIQPLPKVHRLLEELVNNKYIIGAITDSPTKQAEKILQIAGIDKNLFSLFLGWEIGERMPKGGLCDVYQKIIREYKLEPSEILMVGDSLNTDIVPAHTCGMKVLHISDNKGNKFPSIKSVEMLPDILEKL